MKVWHSKELKNKHNRTDSKIPLKKWGMTRIIIINLMAESDKNRKNSRNKVKSVDLMILLRQMLKRFLKSQR